MPDRRTPDAASAEGTGSAVFRLVTHRRDFGDVAVSFSLRNEGVVSTASTPPVAWDGVHVFLRYQSPDRLYSASANRRDGTVVIKKKCPGGASNGGTYFSLSTSGIHAVPYGEWQHVVATVRNLTPAGVELRLEIGGRVVAAAVDDGFGCAPIRSAGAVGIRGDNANFRLDDFAVSQLDTEPAGHSTKEKRPVNPEPDQPEPTFEQARRELERIVAQLEGGDAGLEEAIALWERGEALYRLCLAKLDAAQGRVEQLGRELSGVAPQAGPEGGEPDPLAGPEGS